VGGQGLLRLGGNGGLDKKDGYGQVPEELRQMGKRMGHIGAAVLKDGNYRQSEMELVQK